MGSKMAVFCSESYEFEFAVINYMADDEVFLPSDLSVWFIPGTVDLNDE